MFLPTHKRVAMGCCSGKPSSNDASTEIANELSRVTTTNRAFVFIKPHAATDATEALVRETFNARGINILAAGTLTGPGRWTR